MATTDAIAAVCSAIAHILRSAMNAESQALGLAEPATFSVYVGEDFTDANSERHVNTGASIYLYRVAPNPSHRTPTGRLLPDGHRQRPQLPVDLHILVTLWGKHADTQNRLLGWIMRTLEDYPILPASILNLGPSGPAFRDDETVELTIGEMAGEEMLELWDQIGKGELFYRISIPYVASNIRIESARALETGAGVQVRTLDVQRITNARAQ